MVGNADYAEPLAQMDGFIARADKLLGTTQPLAGERRRSWPR